MTQMFSFTAESNRHRRVRTVVGEMVDEGLSDLRPSEVAARDRPLLEADAMMKALSDERATGVMLLMAEEGWLRAEFVLVHNSNDNEVARFSDVRFEDGELRVELPFGEKFIDPSSGEPFVASDANIVIHFIATDKLLTDVTLGVNAHREHGFAVQSV
jgi:hypothetical protein